MATISLPQFTDSVDYRYFLEPITGATRPLDYLASFPDALYNKSPDSHFTRFMYTIMGPVGIGWIQKVLLRQRLQLEAHGSLSSDLEALYGNPFSLARIAEESYSDDVSGLLTAAQWDEINQRDELFRSRAIQFLHAVRLGGTPDGMQLAASSGIGQEVSIIENYRALFDLHSDDPLGLQYVGDSSTLGEFIVLPRPALSRSEVQTIDFASAALPLGTNNLVLTFNGFSATLASTAQAPDVQNALAGPTPLPTIGTGNVIVTGGPAPAAFVLTFVAALSNQVLPTIGATFLDGSSNATIHIPVEVATGVVDPVSEAVVISDADRHAMETAIDLLRPVASYPSYGSSNSNLGYLPSSTITGTSAYTRVLRYVTGSPSINWPALNSDHWIESSIEIEAPQLNMARAHHYVGFHNVQNVTSYTDLALSDPQYGTSTAILSQYASLHAGPFPDLVALMPFFAQFNTSYSQVFGPSQALADFAEPLTITDQTDDGTAFINDIYPADYLAAQGAPALQFLRPHFWASSDRQSGADILEIDLGVPQAVNLLTFEMSEKPVDIAVHYDLLDQAPTRTFVPVNPLNGFPAVTYFNPANQTQWQYFELNFDDGLGQIFTRFIRLTFTRRADSTTYGRFLYDTVNQVQLPWTIDVRNLRVGRVVAP